MGLFDKLKEQMGGGGNNLPLPGFSKPNANQVAPAPTPAPAPVQNVQPAPAPVQNQAPVAPAPQSTGDLYDAEIEKLIEFALADGELTEKEKQVLFKKAQAKGIDLDEFEMVLDARLYNAKQQQQQSQPQPQAQPISSAPKSDKYGDVKKCPACGAMITAFSAICPECGHEFSNIAANSSIQRLFEMLNQVEAESKEDPSGLIGGMARTMGSIYSFGGDKDTRKKKAIIQNFPIPTTKDDILEFLSLAVPLARKPSFMDRLNAAPNSAEKIMPGVWKAKCEQIIMKAKFSLKDDKQTLEMIREYANELNIKM